MNCRRAVSRLSAYLDGELTGQEMLLIRKHLSECQSCTSELADIREIKMSLSELTPATPGDEFLGSIFQGLDRVHSSYGGIRFSWAMYKLNPFNNFAKAGLAVAVCCFLVLSLNFFDNNMSNRIEYTGNQNVALLDSGFSKLSGMLTVSGEPYSISNDKPLPVMNNRTPYAYCRARCEDRGSQSHVLMSEDKNPYINPQIVVSENTLYQ